MSRANRNFLPGHVWHVTQRCHKKEFLLKFRKDKRCWIRWAIEAKRRYGLAILNFMITSNHIHLLTMALRSKWACRGHGALSSALQLVESRVAEDYNARKDRGGAFWEDRFHGTAIESGPQLIRCLTYIDMNMTRAGVVGHPRDWPWCGYSELGRESAEPVLRRRSFVVDTDALLDLLGLPDVATLLARRTEWVDAAIRKGRLEREAFWTESVAIGSEKFLRSFQSELGPKIGVAEIRKHPASGGEFFSLKRTRGHPLLVFGGKNGDLSPKKAGKGDLSD